VRRSRSLLPYVLLAPGMLWLALFFLIPIFTMAYRSLQEGTFAGGFEFTWHFANYPDVISQFDTQLVRSFRFAAVATVLAFAIGYPLAYAIAFRGARLKNLLLFLVILPFFTTYLIRTLAWETILADQGDFMSTMRDLHVLDVTDALGISKDGRVLATSTAVVTGITYNFLPFMVLPIYVSLERIDRNLIEAANDLYAGSMAAFRKVVLPLSLPGVFAGSLLTFIPATGDFVNAQLLGGPKQQMIGNVIQIRFLQVLDYPAAAALSFVLMAAILIAVLVYARLLGTEELTP
jgi:spermidine/putrescine transport system permease protein